MIHIKCLIGSLTHNRYSINVSYYYISLLLVLLLFLAAPWHAEIPGPVIQPDPQQWQY